MKNLHSNFTEILRNFEKFAEPVQSHLFPNYWGLGFPALTHCGHRAINIYSIYIFTLSLTINTVHIYIAVMWIHMGYNADPDPGSGSASIRIPKKLSEIKKEFQTKNRVPVTYKYKICFLVFIVYIQYLHNFWFNLTHFEFKYTVCFYFLSSSFTHFLGVYFWRFFTFWIRIQDVSQNADPDAPHHCYTLHTVHSIL